MNKVEYDKMADEGERSKQCKERENEALRGGLNQAEHQVDRTEERTLTDRLNARLLLSLQQQLSQAEDGFLRRVQEAPTAGDGGDSNRRQEEEEDW